MGYALEVEVGGQILNVSYSVTDSHIVEVKTPFGKKQTEQGNRPAILVARSLARELVLDAKSKGLDHSSND